MGNGEWGMGNEQWGMGNGEWGMGNGKWEMRNGEWEIASSFTLTILKWKKFSAPTINNNGKIHPALFLYFTIPEAKKIVKRILTNL